MHGVGMKVLFLSSIMIMYCSQANGNQCFKVTACNCYTSARVLDLFLCARTRR